MKINKNKLVMQAVQGGISHPMAARTPYRMDREGKGQIVPGTGGISYNVRIGDPAFGWAGDHIEPGVSMKISDKSKSSDNYGLGLLACIGNKAKLISGDAEGTYGYVTGTHGGIDHVIVDFEPEVLEKLKIGDEILIKAFGQGLKLKDYPDISVFNLDPNLLDKMNITQHDDHIEVGVTTEIPAHLMGSGIGASSVALGDYDITTGDEEAIKEANIDQLKLGDFVYLKDCDNTYGREFKKGAGSIGVVVHSDCIKMGHGPGVTTVLTARSDIIRPKIDKNANLINYLYD